MAEVPPKQGLLNDQSFGTVAPYNLNMVQKTQGLLGQNFMNMGYGKRLGDNGQKGTGFFGKMVRPDGNISTELSVGVEIDGKEVLVPSLVPTLTQDEINQVLTTGGVPSKTIAMKAADHARNRISQGLSPFWQEGEQTYFGEYQY
tara:strand:+ start:75 stop:509 length:435 start_codon:yes stop_codon:yes gene_type:complete